MLAKRLIPCLDVDGGRVVKGVKFVALRDAGDPVECAVRYDAEGADELVFLDITASSDARPIVLDMVRRVADAVYLPFTVGGGVRSLDDAEALLRAGADKVAVNTAAVQAPELIEQLSRRFGAQAVVLAVDARARGGGRWEVYVHGGRTPTGRDVVAWVREGMERGAGEVLLTSMDKDGTKDGFDVPLTRVVAEAVHGQSAVRLPVVLQRDQPDRQRHQLHARRQQPGAHEHRDLQRHHHEQLWFHRQRSRHPDPPRSHHGRLHAGRSHHLHDLRGQ